MTIDLLNSYLVLNLLVILASFVFWAIRALNQSGIFGFKASSELKLNYWALGLCFTLPFLSLCLKDSFQAQPIAKIEAAKTIRIFDSHINESVAKTVVGIGHVKSEMAVDSIVQGLGFIFVISFLLGIFKLCRDLWKLRELINGTYTVRSIGSLRIAVSGRIQSPFSARLLRSWIVIPVDLLTDSQKFKISVLHEIQHHRQKDTLLIYLVLLMKSVLLLNPCMWIWEKLISEIQETACDENLVDQGRVNRQAYARCLIEIAETAVNRKEQLVCAAGLAFLEDRHSISRRIKSMFQERKNRTFTLRFLVVGLSLAFAGAAMATRELVLDRRVSMMEAQRMAEVARANTEFPIVMNDLVLKQLNRYLGTEDGRQFVRDSIIRMQDYKLILDGKVSQYHMPSEILAVGIVETGYRNLAQPSNKSWGAGVWSFIESTAKVFGLRVDSSVDERLNVELETDAAMRYLLSNQLRFKDWLLAIQAYNSGENAVASAIEKYGTRDVWKLIRSGLPTDKDYLARVMAVVLILKNPSVLN